MPGHSDDASSEPDWAIELGEPMPERAGDPRLPLAAAILRASQAQLHSILAATAAVEDVIRDAAQQGATRHTLAAELSLSIEAVDRVIAGGTVFDWPER